MKTLSKSKYAIRIPLFAISFVLLSSCGNKSARNITDSRVSNYLSESEILEKSQSHDNPRMRYKVLSSRFKNGTSKWSNLIAQLEGFSEVEYQSAYSLIYNKDIPTIQKHISKGLITYESLSKWYLYRIYKYESNPSTALNSIISIMPDVVAQAKKKDRLKESNHPIYGMPVLLKDNINAQGTPTTAGAIALSNNNTGDATIVKNLKSAGAIILGKANLSEWAYYFCDGCPLGYSAVGGQTLNPYGRMVFETGGSSAASGTSMAANYATGAVGTETAGSILSPSSQNSVVGLKPTVGVLSRTGIVPISSTLDTPGPMTRSVIDNCILLSAMYGADKDDRTTLLTTRKNDFVEKATSNLDRKDIVLAANRNYIETDPLYSKTVEKLINQGVKIIEFDPSEVDLSGFTTVLDYDMKIDLPHYFINYGGNNLPVSSVSEVITYNSEDMHLRAPYGQTLFEGSTENETSQSEMNDIKIRLETDMRKYFDKVFELDHVDAILSINNYDAARSAMAKYPCLAMPMGYAENGEPKSMTFIGKRFSEASLLQLGHWFEQNIFIRSSPKGY
ncbi:MAG: amidase [Saprospiraceae bacterium]|mgnify:CR=1 FL=1|jgi:amidase